MSRCMFAFVILHYKTDKDTIECIESILNMNTKSNIVIVDNNSNNGSIENIENRYKNNSNIYIIKNNTNVGFAEGNNIGYQYAKQKLESDFIMVCNNDIVFDDKDFISKCIHAYDRTGAQVIGPDIQSLADGMHQSPMSNTLVDTKSVSKEILRYRILLLLSQIGLYDCLRSNKPTSQKIKNAVYWKEEQQNVVLHGAAVLFTPKYVNVEELAFQHGTFLYMEEAILYRYIMKNNYISAYIPTLHVFHKEDSSTNTLFKENKSKREFIFKNMIKSLKVYKKYFVD